MNAILRLAATALVAGLASTAVAMAAAGPKTDQDKCVAKAREAAGKQLAKGAAREDARRQLEAAITACDNPEMAPETAWFRGAVQADLARFGREFLTGVMDPLAYRNARLDRTRKLNELGTSLALHKLFMKGDEDVDLIPDAKDRCPGTADGVPTDNAGCPVPGERQAPEGDEDLFRRRLATVKFIHNEACTGALKPLTPQPFAFGRTASPSGAFKMLASQIGGMPPGCTLFYEFYLHFTNPAGPNLPASRDVVVVFSENEDLYSQSGVVAFALPPGPQLSANRMAAFAAFTSYERVSIRLRVAAGATEASRWSPPVPMMPAPGGIQ